MQQRIALAEDDLDAHERLLAAMDEKLVAAVDRLGEQLNLAVREFGDRVGSLEGALRNAAVTILVGVAITVLGGALAAHAIFVERE